MFVEYLESCDNPNMTGVRALAYVLHINWIDSEDDPITLGELQEYFSNKKDFEYSDGTSITGPVTISISGDFFVWANGSQKVPFLYKKGRLNVARPDDDTLDKMVEIAADLQAKVQGDEGEYY